ncbi:hypothetical protein DFP73DRAFT_601529 [Morchella snyderi]|nr:hypothetical protein DFP73DRAFT_601529 [Morchella snyderi]
MQGWCEELMLCFHVKGHTRNSVDRGFAITKNELNRSELYVPDQYIEIVNRSCKTGQTKIEAISFLDDIGNKTIFPDWYQQKDLGLVKEKRHDMWAKYSKHVPEQFKDTWIYTKPESELIKEVKSVKNGRSKESKKSRFKEATDSEDSDSVVQDGVDPGATASQQARSTGAKKRGRPTGSLETSQRFHPHTAALNSPRVPEIAYQHSSDSYYHNPTAPDNSSHERPPPPLPLAPAPPPAANRRANQHLRRAGKCN